MINQNSLGGTFSLPHSNIVLNRMGYGAMQLAGPQVWGPPRNVDTAIEVLRESLGLGVNHIDTSDYYGPHTTNEVIKRALYPYPKGLTLVTKVGNRRAADKSWPTALSEKELESAVQDNLNHLNLEALDVVNLRLGDPHGPNETSLEAPLGVLIKLKQKGLIRNIGLSNVTLKQFNEAEAMTSEIVCVQNHYNLAHRKDDAFIDLLAKKGIAYTPFFPLGGFSPLQSSKLTEVANLLGATPMQVALAWLLQRSPNILLIPGTSSLAHLRENIEATELKIPRDSLKTLDSIGKKAD